MHFFYYFFFEYFIVMFEEKYNNCVVPQGFAKYMLEVTPYVVDKGVIIGYDARHNSRR